MIKKRRAGLIIACWITAACCLAQQPPKSAAVADATSSRLDIFAGYSDWMPHAAVNGHSFASDNAGMLFSGAYYFNQHLGGQFEGERHQQTATEGMRAFAAGPIFRISAWKGFAPFAHGLAGAAEVTGPDQPSLGGSSYYFNPERWGAILTAGGGVDFAAPIFRQRLNIRLLQADYQYAHINFGPLLATTGGRANINAVRLSVGIVYRIGSVTSAAW